MRTSHTGLRTSTTFDLGGATLIAKGMAGWRHAFGDVTPLAVMRFAGGGDAFDVGGVPIARNAAVLEAGFDCAITPYATLGVSHNGRFGYDLSDQSVNATFNMKFRIDRARRDSAAGRS
ncbi:MULTISPECIES: autotransporter domain-containing protein [unclassified Mesorhizobium]|nr:MULTISPECIES: autotransporter domain-containing protein [unclassified Mesorhizobium]